MLQVNSHIPAVATTRFIRRLRGHGELAPCAAHSAAAAAEWVRREHTTSAYLPVLAQAMHVHEQRFVGQRAVIDITDRLAEAGVLQVEGVVNACADALDSFEGP